MAVVFSFLASEEASYITGTGKTIYACGGFTLFEEFRENWAS
jgi:glucose 1-dehydrogenase